VVGGGEVYRVEEGDDEGGGRRGGRRGNTSKPLEGGVGNGADEEDDEARTHKNSINIHQQTTYT
jgi:hypothetical protein